jgi:hypothetical protein
MNHFFLCNAAPMESLGQEEPRATTILFQRRLAGSDVGNADRFAALYGLRRRVRISI